MAIPFERDSPGTFIGERAVGYDVGVAFEQALQSSITQTQSRSQPPSINQIDGPVPICGQSAVLSANGGAQNGAPHGSFAAACGQNQPCGCGCAVAYKQLFYLMMFMYFVLIAVVIAFQLGRFAASRQNSLPVAAAGRP